MYTEPVFAVMWNVIIGNNYQYDYPKTFLVVMIMQA